MNGGIGKAKGNYLIMVITLSIIAAGLSYYFLVFVPQNEEVFIEKNFRELNQLSSNFSSRAQSLVNNGKNILNSSISSDSIVTQLCEIDTVINDHRENLEVLSALKNQLNDKVKLFNKRISITNLDFYTDFDHELKNRNQQVKVSVDNPEKTTILYSDFITLNGSVFKEAFQQIPSCKYKDQLISLKYDVEVSPADLIEDLLHFDQFEHFLITKEDWVIYQSHPSGTLMFNTTTPDSITTFEVSSVRPVTLNGVRYHAFIRPLFISQREHWNLIGFTRSEIVNQARMNIPLRTSLLLLTASVFIILLIPFIKILLINSKEKLSAHDLGLSYLSIVLIVALITIALMWVFQYNQEKKIYDSKLIAVSENILESYEAEVGHILKLLNEQETSSNNDFESESSIEITDSAIVHYPFFEIMFWLNESGKQVKKVTTEEYITPAISVSSRMYFKSYMLNENFADTSFDPDLPFYLESIVSHNTGEKLAVVSIKKDSANEVIGVTTRLHSLINTAFPAGFGFSLIDDNGKVLFHSDPDKNLAENFLDEFSESSELQGLLRSGNKGFISGEYHNKRVRILKSEPGDSNAPYHLITFFDSELLYTKYARIIQQIFVILIIGGVLCSLILFSYLKYKGIFLSELPIFKPKMEVNAAPEAGLMSLDSYKSVRWIKMTEILFLAIIIPGLVFHTVYCIESVSFDAYFSNTETELIDEKKKNDKIYVDSIVGKRLIQKEIIEGCFGVIYSSFETNNCPKTYFLYKDSSNFSGNYIDADQVNDSTHLFNISLFKPIPITQIGYELSNYRPSFELHISSLLVSVIDILPYLFFAGLLIGLFVIIYRLLTYLEKRFFISTIQSLDNYSIEHLNEALLNQKNQKMFLVSVFNSKDIELHLSLPRCFDKEHLNWSDFKKLSNFRKFEFSENQNFLLILKGFPGTVSELDYDDIKALEEIPDIKTIIISKQSPLLLAKEIGGTSDHKKKNLFDPFVNAISEFSTFYSKLNINIENKEREFLKTRFQFTRIIQNLSEEERYVLFDLAEDGLVNVENYEIINALYKKGIIKGNFVGSRFKKSFNAIQLNKLTNYRKVNDIYEKGINKNNFTIRLISSSADISSLRFFDEDRPKKNIPKTTFRTAILEIVDKAKLSEFIKTAEYKSTWARLRTPIILVFVGLFVFIMITQKEYFNQAIGIVSSLIAAITLFSRLTNSLSLGFGKGAKSIQANTSEGP